MIMSDATVVGLRINFCTSEGSVACVESYTWDEVSTSLPDIFRNSHRVASWLSRNEYHDC